MVFLCISVNIREEERETLIETEVGKRLTISFPNFLPLFSSLCDSTQSFVFEK